MKEPYNLIIGLRGKGNRIYISRDVIRLLGMPSYVCLYKAGNYKSIAIGKCNAKNVMSFKVPDKLLAGEKCDCMIHSKSFLDAVMSANNLDRGKSYKIPGKIVEDQGIVTFQIDLAQLVQSPMVNNA